MKHYEKPSSMATIVIHLHTILIIFWKFDFHRIDWHWHHELEFLYTAEGTALCLIGTSKIELHKGCGIFINSGVLHRFEAQSSTFAPNIVFSPTLLAPENSLIYEK